MKMKFSVPLSFLAVAVLFYVLATHPFLQRRPTRESYICDEECNDGNSGSNDAFGSHVIQHDETTRIDSEPPVVRTPPPLSVIQDVPQAQISRLANNSFLSPFVFKTYVRPSLSQSVTQRGAVDVFLFSLGLHIRQLSVSHCLIGDKLYPVQSYTVDVTLCIVPDFRTGSDAQSDAVVTVVIDPASKGLSIALGGDLTLNGGHVARPLVQGHDVVPYRLSPTTQNAVVKVGTTDLRGMIKNKTTDVLLAVRSEQFAKDVLVDDFDPVRAHTEKRYAVCMASMTATSPHIIPPWVDYHRTLGVDHVYVFDNGLNADLTLVFGNRTDVEIVPWPWQKTQTQAMSFMLLAARRRCQILFKPDTDEYALVGLLPAGGDFLITAAAFASDRRPLHAFLQNRRERYNDTSLQIKSLVLCNSGFVNTPAGAPPELYTHVRRDQEARSGKSFCDTMLDFRSAEIHPCGLTGSDLRMGRLSRDVSEADLDDIPELMKSNAFWNDQAAPSSVTDTAWLMHYYERSWEEWTEKWSIGVANIDTGVGRDNRIGKFNKSEPDPEFVDKNNERCYPYTFFKNVFQDVMRYKEQRCHQSVLVWNENSSESSIIVSI